MKVDGKPTRTIWLSPQSTGVVQIIDQRFLPHRFVVEDLTTVEQVCEAIREMHVRGAGLIGATAGFGMHLAAAAAASSCSTAEAFVEALQQSGEQLKRTRPTAVNLECAVDRQLRAISRCSPDIPAMTQVALHTAQEIADEDAEFCRRIGEHGLPIIEALARRKRPGEPVNILTHCNAGWLAFVDYGTATAPIYAAHDRGIAVHVWVDETRPRNQGAKLTAWELLQHGVPHTVIADNTGGHLMQHQMVDMVITGTDRTTRAGDVANKIGTYLKALAAFDNQVPFYVALPSTTFDWNLREGKDIPIEQRGSREVQYVDGLSGEALVEVLVTPEGSPAANYGFDVTPRRLVTGLITERGVCEASEESILALFPERRSPSHQ
eukprot:RCo022308